MLGLGELIVAGGEGAALLEAVDQALEPVPLPQPPPGGPAAVALGPRAERLLAPFCLKTSV